MTTTALTTSQRTAPAHTTSRSYGLQRQPPYSSTNVRSKIGGALRIKTIATNPSFRNESATLPFRIEPTTSTEKCLRTNQNRRQKKTIIFSNPNWGWGLYNKFLLYLPRTALYYFNCKKATWGGVKRSQSFRFILVSTCTN